MTTCPQLPGFCRDSMAGTALTLSSSWICSGNRQTAKPLTRWLRIVIRSIVTLNSCGAPTNAWSNPSTVTSWINNGPGQLIAEWIPTAPAWSGSDERIVTSRIAP